MTLFSLSTVRSREGKGSVSVDAGAKLMLFRFRNRFYKVTVVRIVLATLWAIFHRDAIPDRAILPSQLSLLPWQNCELTQFALLTREFQSSLESTN